MADIINMAEAVEGNGFEIKMDWIDLKDEERSWEPLQTTWDEAPQFVKTELQMLGLSPAIRSRLQQEYGIKLWFS